MIAWHEFRLLSHRVAPKLINSKNPLIINSDHAGVLLRLPRWSLSLKDAKGSQHSSGPLSIR